MNTPRVWGGGIYTATPAHSMTRATSTACSCTAADLQYTSDAGGSHGPVDRRLADAGSRNPPPDPQALNPALASHPSIVMWDARGGNEVVVTPNTTSYLFATQRATD